MGFLVIVRQLQEATIIRHESADSLGDCSLSSWAAQFFCASVTPLLSFSCHPRRHFPSWRSMLHCDPSHHRKNLSSFHQMIAVCGKCSSAWMTCAPCLRCPERSRPTVLMDAPPVSGAILAQSAAAAALLFPSWSLWLMTRPRRGAPRWRVLMPPPWVKTVPAIPNVVPFWLIDANYSFRSSAFCTDRCVPSYFYTMLCLFSV